MKLPNNTRSVFFTNSIFLFETPSFVFNFLFNSIIKWNSYKKRNRKKDWYEQIRKCISKNNDLEQRLLSKGPRNKCRNITYNNCKQKQTHNILSNQYINFSDNRTKYFKVHDYSSLWVMGLGIRCVATTSNPAFNDSNNILTN